MASSRLAVGGGDDAAVDLVAGGVADGPHFLVLQHAQQFALRVNRHFGNFVQEQRAALGLPEQALRGPRCAPVNAPFLRAEQLALDQFAGQRGAIDLDDAVLGARAQRVDQIGDDFLAGAAFAGDQNGHVAGRHAFDGAHDGLQGGALENRGRAAAHGGERPAERIVLLLLLAVFDRAVNGDLRAPGGRKAC